jgi:SAM-dependent methyltransferase
MYLLPPPLRLEWDHFMRHLPRPTPGRNRLLDIGCGNGDFLIRAKDAGWEVTGLDFDPVAAQTAQRRGVEARVGKLEDSPYVEASFDVITANQVIEHAHDPAAFLRSCWHLLKPGGRLWIGTPNLDTPAARRFGVHWQMLETPRHLILFTPSSLTYAFTRAGINPPDYRPRGWCIAWIMQDSANISRGALANTVDRIDTSVQLAGAWQELGAWIRPSRGVELTAVVHKPI